MKPGTTNSIMRVFFSSLRNIAYICYSSLEYVLSGRFSLPIEARHRLSSAESCTLHINRMVQIFDYLLETDGFRSDSFDPQQILEQLSDTFLKTVSGYTKVSIEVYSKMKNSPPLMVNKDVLELIILNILYASLRNADEHGRKSTKLALYLTENRNSIVIHIRDNCPLISPQIIENVFSGKKHRLNKEKPFQSVITLSLDLANLTTVEINGKFDYRALKSGNRFDIALPKCPASAPMSVAGSPKKYLPTHYYFKKFFADLSPDDTLTESDLWEA